MDSTRSLLLSLAQVPSLLATLGAVVFAIVRWNRHPVTSLLMVTAGGVQLMTRTASLVVGRLGVDLQWWFVGQALLGTVGYVLLLVAVFSERQSTTLQPQQRW